MAIHTRRWNDAPGNADGTRILVCRYRPRGLPKGEETWDEWIVDLAPSKGLHAAVYGSGGQMQITWESYRKLYLQEMIGRQQLINELARRVHDGETLTLLCSSACEREGRCHRSLLKVLIERAMLTLSGGE